jgi:hypothetical protein
MHCDSLVGEEVEGGAGPIVHEPPRRVFVALPGSGRVAVSDYLYPGEGIEDSLPAIQVGPGMRYCEISKEMSSLYFGLAVFCLFEARVPELDMQPPHPTPRTVYIVH